MRDDFDRVTKEVLARRVAHRCSNPECRKLTSGPQTDPTKSLNIGVAAHITAAAPGGPRYAISLSPQERKAINNGIWLCQNCAKIIDSDEARFSADTLRTWKRMAEEAARMEVESSSQFDTDNIITASYKPLYRTLFNRVQFLHEIQNDTDIDLLVKKVDELIDFVASLSIGAFYSQKLASLLRQPAYGFSYRYDFPESFAERQARQLGQVKRDQAYRDQLFQARDEVQMLCLEIVQVQG